MSYTPTNRERARRPTGGRFYCMSCDGFYGNAEKCPRCGKDSTPKHKERIRDARPPEDA